MQDFFFLDQTLLRHLNLAKLHFMLKVHSQSRDALTELLMKKPHFLKRLEEDGTRSSCEQMKKTDGPWHFASQEVSCDCELAGAAGQAGQDG